MPSERLPHIEPLHLADVTLPDAHPRAGQPCPIFAFLIRHPAGLVLVDTGVGDGHAGIDKLYAPQRRLLKDELAARGVAVEDVTAVINTHLHFDHCGENRLFAGVPIHVQRVEHEAAQEPLYTIPGWIDFQGAQYELHEGEAELLLGIRLIPTPGHTPGHQSVVIESSEGRIVIAGQAVYDAAEFQGAAPAGEWDDELYATSAASLRDLKPDRVYFSHDAVVWER